MVKDRLLNLQEWAKNNVQDCIMPFWTSDYIVDPVNGGFYGRVTLDMQIDNSEPRGLTLTGRMLYAFSAAYMAFGNEIYLEKAAYTFRDLVSRFYDRQYGGAFISVAADGTVLDDSKPNYCEAFLIMGCAAYYRASGDPEALRIAEETYGLMETKCRFAPSSYYGNMTRNWEKADGTGFGKRKGPQMPEGSVMFPHHLCQSYVQLYRANGSEAVRESLKEMAVFLANKAYDPVNHNFMTSIGPDGKRIGTRQSYGHDCEISYLAVRVAELTGDRELQKVMCEEVADVLRHVLDEDFDEYGSLYNGGDLENPERDRTHVWWAQAEAVTAMLCGYQLTGEIRFLSACEQQIRFIDKYFINRADGDWYNNILVTEEGGKVVDGMHGFDKLNGGKCPFHNTQMCLEVIERTNALMEERTDG